MVYENIKRLCEKQSISIGTLEKKANLGHGTVGKWKEINPSLTSLKKVAVVLNVPVVVLMEEGKCQN